MEKDKKALCFLKEFDKLQKNLAVLNFTQEKGFLKDYKLSEVHCLDAVYRLPDVNVTKLTEDSHITKGAVSKIIKKLLRSGAIYSYKKPENKKEIYFGLTEKGKLIAEQHVHFHHVLHKRDIGVFYELSDTEKDAVMKFMDSYNRHLQGKLTEKGEI